MIEVFPRLFVGSQYDYESGVQQQDGWSVVHACKEPYHRRALGYSGRAAPKDHPEYLIARRGDRLILNLVDAADPAYIPKEIIDAAIDFIHARLTGAGQVLVHCNEGYSRGPSIAFLYLVSRTGCFSGNDLAAALDSFRSRYSSFNPAAGMQGFIRLHYEGYRRATTQ